VANIEIIPAPLYSSAFPPPLSPPLCPGASPDLLRPLLWCGGLAGAFMELCG